MKVPCPSQISNLCTKSRDPILPLTYHASFPPISKTPYVIPKGIPCFVTLKKCHSNP